MPAQSVELAFQFFRLQIQPKGQPEEGEVVHWGRGLHFAALLTEMRRAHGSARPAISLGWATLVHDQDAALFGFFVVSRGH